MCLPFVTPWTVARQLPLSMEFSSKNIGVGCHFLFQEIFLTPGSNPHLLHWQAYSLALHYVGSSIYCNTYFFKSCQFRARDGTFIMTSNPKILLPKMLKLPFFLVNEMLFDDCTVMRVYTNLSSKESKTILETRFSFNSGIFIHCITKNVSVSLTIHVFPEGRDIV